MAMFINGKPVEQYQLRLIFTTFVVCAFVCLSARLSGLCRRLSVVRQLLLARLA